MTLLSSAEQGTTAASNPCSKCDERAAVLHARMHNFCKDCYAKFHIGGKVMKRMSVYKVRTDEPPRRLLLALSLGVSSLSLLHVLATQLRSSLQRIGRYGYTLDVLIMDDRSVFQHPDEPKRGMDDKLQGLAVLFPPSDYPMILSFAYRSTETSFNEMRRKKSDVNNMFKDLLISDSQIENGSTAQQSNAYRDYIVSLASLSAQSDANDAITRRFITKYALDKGCHTVLWGDSTTRLAERTLAEAAKGRGFSLPWLTADGPTPLGVEFRFPFRDLLRKEIVAYAEIATEPPLTQWIRQEKPLGTAQVSSKDATIDSLMLQYFQTVEQNFPSIVANVVKTSSKLQGDATSSDGKCQLCSLPVPRGGQGLHAWPGSQNEVASSQIEFLCYGCARTAHGRAT